MTHLNALILGIIQGLTEFLPVSSSGHLVLAQHLLGMKEPILFFDVMLHLGTLVSVLFYFRKDIVLLLRYFLKSGEVTGVDWLPAQADAGGYLLRMIIAMIPAAVAGVAVKHTIESMFASPLTVCVNLAITGALLLWASAARPGETSAARLPYWKVLLIGIAQAFALAPGISRSGATIAAGLLLGVRRTDAARFSFLLSIPAVAGATMLEIMKEGHNLTHAFSNATPVLIGTVTAMLMGIAAIYLVIETLRRGRLALFAFYCWAVAIIGFIALKI